MHPLEVRAEALQLYESGVNAMQVARRIGIPYATVARWTHGGEVAPMYTPFTDAEKDAAAERYWRGEKAVAIAADLGVAEGTIRTWISKRGKTRPQPSLSFKDAVAAYRKAGSYGKAAKLLGVTKSTVWRAINS